MFKLYAIRVFTTRWEQSFEFYRDTIGFPVFYADAEQGWAQFDLGGCYLGLERCAPNDPEAADLVGRFVATSVEVPDIEATYQALRDKGVEFTGAPERQPWGGVLAHFKDPDGNVITLLGTSQPQ